jgi:hypothetical protein
MILNGLLNPRQIEKITSADAPVLQGLFWIVDIFMVGEFANFSCGNFHVELWTFANYGTILN